MVQLAPSILTVTLCLGRVDKIMHYGEEPTTPGATILFNRSPQPLRAARKGVCSLGTIRPGLAGFRFTLEVITVAVHCYLCYGLSCRDVAEVLAKRRVAVDHHTIYR